MYACQIQYLAHLAIFSMPNMVEWGIPEKVVPNAKPHCKDTKTSLQNKSIQPNKPMPTTDLQQQRFSMCCSFLLVKDLLIRSGTNTLTSNYLYLNISLVKKK